jgi:putative transposase
MHAKYSTAEIADVLQVAQRTVNRWAKEENWLWINEKTLSGLPIKKYLISVLPDNRREELQALLAVPTAGVPAAVNGERSLAVIEESERCITTLKGWQRKIMDARVALYREFQRLEREYGTNKAIRTFVTLAKTESLPEQLQQLVPIANARSGKKTSISKSTIYRWKDMSKNGLVGFAPQEMGTDEPPPWVDCFLRCYRLPENPTIPEAMEDMAKILPEGMEMPSYSQVYRHYKKLSRLDREKGRKTGSALMALKGHRVRDTSELLPCDVCVCDGHSYKAKVAHPVHGKPFKPEICTVIDAATRVAMGWSVGLAESALTVADAVRHAVTTNETKPAGGMIGILYTDGGSGNKAFVNTDDITGIFTRLGIEHQTGIAGNAQARGLIEILNKTLWIRSAKKLPTFVGKQMDKLTERNRYLAMERDFRLVGKSDILPSWPQFIEHCRQSVEAYNRRPHSSLPRITDPETGRRRHMAPFEAWAWHINNGWNHKKVQLSEQEIEVLFLPREKKTVSRATVKLFGNSYYNKMLEHYEGGDVQVGYDIHNGEKVQIWSMEDQFIGHAFFEKNKSSYFPMSQVEHARDLRAKRRAKIKLDQLEEIEAERRGVIELIPVKNEIITFPGTSPKIRVDRSQLALEMKEETVEIPPDDRGKYRLWNDLEGRLENGDTITEKEMNFFEAYRNTRSYRAFKSVEENFAAL